MFMTLRRLCDHWTIKDIAKERGVVVKRIYQQRKVLQKKGYLNQYYEPTSKAFASFEGVSETSEKITRLHNVRFRVRIRPKTTKPFAEQRREILELGNIPYRVLSRKHWDGFFFAIDEWRCEVTPKSFLLIAPDRFTRDSQEGLLDLFFDVKKIVIKLEDRFGVRALDKGNRLNVRAEATHAALINNALAKKYNRERKTFELHDADGQLRLIIDNSLHLDELEAVNPIWAVDDDAKIKRLYYEAVVQDISLAKMRDKISEIERTLGPIVHLQELQAKNAILTMKGVKDLRDYIFSQDEEK